MAASQHFCTNCGAANRLAAVFCFACGHSLQTSEKETTVLATASTPSGAFSIPTHLLKDRYRITARLGKGGMGAVYKAEDTLFNKRPVAVKEMSQSGLDTQQRATAADDFKREAHMLAGLQHSSLPAIHDYFSDDGQWYLVMDFIEGKTLETLLDSATNGWLPLLQAIDIALQLCTVLEYLHTRQPPIIFRDLKPANVMLPPGERVVLIDFGIARLFKPGQLRDTVAFGSAGYAAPEQYGKTQTTPRSDIYSLGAILHECLTGNDPSDNTPTPFNFPPLHLPDRSTPAALEKLLAQMLEMDPGKRPASIASVKQELEDISAFSTSLYYIPQPPLTTQPAIIPTSAPSVVSAAPTSPTPIAPAPAPTQSEVRSTPRTPQTAPIQHTPKIAEASADIVYRNHTSAIQALSWSPDGRYIVSGDESGRIQAWEATTKKLFLLLEGHSHAIHALAWSPVGTYIAMGDSGGRLEVWHVEERRRVYTYRAYSGGITGISWSPGGSLIASSDDSGRAQIRDARNGNNLFTYPNHSSAVRAIAWSHSHSSIASAASDSLIQIWEPATGKLISTYSQHASWVNTLAWSPDGEHIASGDRQGNLHVWEASTGKTLSVYNSLLGTVTSLSWSPDGEHIVLAGDNPTAQVRNIQKGETVCLFREAIGPIHTVAWASDGSRIASGSADKTVQIWTPKI